MHALYINLDSRTDRREQFEDECRRLNLGVERFPAVRRNPGALGCAYSHYNVIKLAKERGYPYVVVFEDDFQFLVSREEFDSVLSSLPADFDVVMLSYDLQKHEAYNERFGRVLEVQSASGYVVSSKFYDSLLTTWKCSLEEYEKQPNCHWMFINDQAWKPLQPISRWYYSLVRIGKQRPSWSDLSNRFADYGK
jgi:glycosyl transferase family 25